MLEDKQALISKLKKDLLAWQGIPQRSNDASTMGLGPLEKAFPNGVFPKGVIHEFVSFNRMVLHPVGLLVVSLENLCKLMGFVFG